MRAIDRLRSADAATRAMLLLSLALVAWSAVRPVAFYPDSTTYIANAVYRPPGYPLLIDLVELVLGASWPRGIVVLQAVLGAWAAHHLTQVLRTRLQLAPVPAVALFALILMPQWQWALAILSESVSYTLFMVLVAELVESCYGQPLRHHVRAAVCMAVLAATRTQLTFVVPVVALHAIAIAWRLRSARLGAGLVALTLAAGGVGTLAQQVSNLWFHGIWARSALSGLPVLGLQLYLSSPDDVPHLADAADRDLLVAVQARMAQARLFRSSEPGISDTAEGFQLNGDRILYGAVVPELRARLHVAEPSARQWVDFDQQALRIARTLAQRRPAAYLAHVHRQIRTMAGFFVLFSLVTAAAGLWLALARQAPWGLALATVAAFAAANHLLVAMVHILQQRYVFITDVTLVVMVAAVLLRETRARPVPPADPL